MYQLSTLGHVYGFHKVRGCSYIPLLQGLWVDTYISESHLSFPRPISTDLLSQRGCTLLNIQKQHQEAVEHMLHLQPDHWHSEKKKINLWLVQAPRIIGSGIRQTTIRSIIGQ